VSSTAPGVDGVFDAHHHLWDTRVLEYRLFHEVPELNRPFLLTDYEPEARSLGVSGSLWVEAASAGADAARELDWVEEHVVGCRLVEGLVASVALERAEGELARLFDSTVPVVGVRRSFEFEDPGFARRPEVAQGARLAAEHGLVVDLVLFPPALPAVLDLVDACPGTQFVLDHLGKPNIARREWEPWASQLRRLSERPNLVAKLSGLATEADRGGWTPTDLRVYVEHALETFGPDRLLYGSDWPVVELAGGHSRWLVALTELLGDLTVDEKRAILSGNARRVYFPVIPC
jgi:L-fucono-1,5-lactonase